MSGTSLTIDLQTGLVVVQNILFAIAAGALACDMLARHTGTSALAMFKGWCFVCACMLVACAPLYLWLQAAVMSDVPLFEAFSQVLAVLTESHYGMTWLVGLLGAVLAALASRGGNLTGTVITVAGLVIWAAGKAAASHAADTGDATPREVVHILHLCATALWAGSVIVTAATQRGLIRRETDPLAITRFLTSVSHLAAISLVVVLLTGISNVLWDTRGVRGQLMMLPWGQILSIKLVCVVLAILLGGWNRMVVLPDLHTQSRMQGTTFDAILSRFGRLLSVEAVVMLVILTIAAILGHTSPSAS